MIDLVIDPFDPKSIKKAYERVKRYSDTFDRKCEIFCEKLLSEGMEIAKRRFDVAQYDGDNPGITVNIEHDGDTWRLTATGEKVFFVEFGTGVYYNGAERYPNRPSDVAGIGEYGKGKGKQQGWYYGDGEYTHGNMPAFAMYEADARIRMRIEELAKEVFAR